MASNAQAVKLQVSEFGKVTDATNFMNAVNEAYLSLCTLDWIIYFNEHEEDAGEDKLREARYKWLRREAEARLEGAGLYLSVGSITFTDFLGIPEAIEKLGNFIIKLINLPLERERSRLDNKRIALEIAKEQIAIINASDSFTPDEKKLMIKELILNPFCKVTDAFEKVQRYISSGELCQE